MGEHTGISWTDSTINVWHGCEKVSPGCKHCYAEVSTPVRVKRAGGLELWGPSGARSETKSWTRDLRRWNRAAIASGKVHRVFAQSLSDTFEDYGGGRVAMADGSIETGLQLLREHFFAVVEECHALTFQILTKRPENIRRMVPPSWLAAWPSHVWIGCTVEDQERAEERIPHLLSVPAAVRFLSVEPQIGRVDLRRVSMLRWDGPIEHETIDALKSGIAWVIQGGESGDYARPFDVDWVRTLREQCRAAGVAYFLKQLGARPHTTLEDVAGSGWRAETKFWQRMPGESTHRLKLNDSHGGDESEWPLDLQGCRAFPVQP